MSAIQAEGGGGGISAALIQWADPWAKFYSHSKPVSAAVLFFHLVPLITAAGSAYAADRATLRLGKGNVAERSRQLLELAGIHRVVVIGLVLSFISGILLFLGDVETFLGSIWFWAKLAFVGLLLINGWVMVRTEASLSASASDDDAAPPLWGRLRILAILSISLWIVTTLVGVVLKEYA